MSIVAVTFDFWNTLVVDGTASGRTNRIDAWMGVLEDAGFAVERDALDLAMASSWERFLARWEANEQYTHVEAAIDILEQLGHDVPDEIHRALLSTFSYSTAQFPTPTDGVAECLRELKSAGIRLGIICDVGMTPSTVLREILDHHGILEYFDHWSFSDDVGAYKPAPEIFEHTLAGLGVTDPASAAHIGDLKRTDVAGARAMGLLALRYSGSFDDVDSPGDDGDHVIADHRDLPGVLGLR